MTGSDGAFQADGLEMGLFDVVACFPRAEHEVDVPPVSKAKQVLASGLLASGEPIEFVVQRPHLVVSLADAHGNPQPWDEVPKGSYRVVVEEANLPTCLVGLPRGRSLRRAERVVLVGPGSVGRVSLLLPDRWGAKASPGDSP